MAEGQSAERRHPSVRPSVHPRPRQRRDVDRHGRNLFLFPAATFRRSPPPIHPPTYPTDAGFSRVDDRRPWFMDSAWSGQGRLFVDRLHASVQLASCLDGLCRTVCRFSATFWFLATVRSRKRQAKDASNQPASGRLQATVNPTVRQRHRRSGGRAAVEKGGRIRLIGVCWTRCMAIGYR